jgi:hypothetical protein
MTNPLIHLPPHFREFQNSLIDQSPLTIRWNDLSREGKEKLATAIKRYSHMWTIRNSEIASVENIILVLDNTNPLLDQSQTNRWSFASGYVSSRYWLKNIGRVINTTLNIRKMRTDWRDFLIAIAGWNHWNEIDAYQCQIEGRNSNRRESIDPFIDQMIRGLNANPRMSNREDNSGEISLADVENAALATAQRNNN